MAGFNPGIWTVAAGGAGVNQSVNGQPTFFYRDFTAFGTSVTEKIRPGGGDDDYVGFALGFQPGDSTNAAATTCWLTGSRAPSLSILAPPPIRPAVTQCPDWQSRE